MSLLRPIAVVSTAAGLLGLAGCAGSGASLPETGGVSPATYMSHFSGRWMMDVRTSDDLSSVPEPPEEDAGPNQPQPGGVACPGAGGRRRPGMPRSRRGCEEPGMIGARSEIEAARATLETLRTFPETFSMEVTDSVVVTTWVGQREIRIPVAADPVRTFVGEREVDASAAWEGGILAVKLNVRDGRTVVDRIEAVPQADRLLVIRTIDGFAGPVPELRLAYDRAE